MVDERIAFATQNRKITTAISGQIEDTFLIWRITHNYLTSDYFSLNTLKLHRETISYIKILESYFNIRIHQLQPDTTATAKFLSTNGETGIYQSVAIRKKCCEIRKIDPLKPYLKNYDGWITGQRREQSLSRNQLAFFEKDTIFETAKFNPLFDITYGDIKTALIKNQIPINPLYVKGYTSIGCEPCTRPSQDDQDLRAGRWWWERNDVKECGLHPKQGAYK